MRKIILCVMTVFLLAFCVSCTIAIPTEEPSDTTVTTTPESAITTSDNHPEPVVPDESTENKVSPAETTEKDDDTDVMTVYLHINDTVLSATLEDNSSATAFYELLGNGDITVEASDYGSFEKVGSLGTELPRNDVEITTEPGDIILYQGNQITVYYDTNTWSFTRLGRINNITQTELKAILGDGNVTITFSLA